MFGLKGTEGLSMVLIVSFLLDSQLGLGSPLLQQQQQQHPNNDPAPHGFGRTY